MYRRKVYGNPKVVDEGLVATNDVYDLTGLVGILGLQLRYQWSLLLYSTGGLMVCLPKDKAGGFCQEIEVCLY